MNENGLETYGTTRGRTKVEEETWGEDNKEQHVD
jgi:hypothetical protein